MRKAAWAVGIVIGAFLVVRAVVELLTLDFSDAASYRDDWGGRTCSVSCLSTPVRV